VMKAAVVITALPSARRALRALGEKRIGVDMLDIAAIGISIGTGQPGTAAFITWLLGLGDLVLEHTGDRARDAISKLMKLDASDAWRIREVNGDEIIEKVSVKKLSIGDRIVIDPGQRVAADGIVVRGVALTDEKALTGESIPQEKRQGDRVLAASVVVEGQIVVEIDRTGKDTTAAKIVQILEGAGAKPMTLQRNAEKVADRLVLPTFGIAGGAALFASQIDRMTSVLITDFGTGIRIAVPTSALTAMTIAARQGVLVKGGQFLERLAKADAIVFDKTGTLTGGAPNVFEVTPLGALRAEESVALAAAAEARQQHPIAEAIRRYAVHLGVDVPDADLGSETYAIGIGLRACVDGREVLVGGRRLMERHGISSAPASAILDRHRALGASSIFVAIEENLEAVIGYADEPRPESAAVVRALKAGGRREIILMSGDARGPVEAVARAIGVDRALFELLPEEKAAHVRALQREGKIVAMIGDGINDAPALAVADVGISLEGGTDVALETADVVLLEGGLLRLPQAFDIADEAMAHVRRGLGLVLLPNGVAIVLGALGLIGPGLAAVVNNGSTVVAAVTALAPLLKKSPRRAKLLL
jgi:heavy metal translocating P-type ATPase